MVPGRSRNIQLRNYIYISDSKLEMLFDQIKQGILKRISAEVKVDLKVVGLTLREADNRPATREAKLRIVERFIELHHKVGTVSDPGQEYFRGQANMKLCDLRNQPSDENQFRAVGFISVDSPSLDAVLLVGSLFHLTGDEQLPIAHENTSNPRVMDALWHVFGRSQIPGAGSGKSENFEQTDLLVAVWQYLSRLSFKQSPALTQRLDFLAVPLAEYRGEDQLHVVLGTPLYVATAH